MLQTCETPAAKNDIPGYTNHCNNNQIPFSSQAILAGIVNALSVKYQSDGSAMGLRPVHPDKTLLCTSHVQDVGGVMSIIDSNIVKCKARGMALSMLNRCLSKRLH